MAVVMTEGKGTCQWGLRFSGLIGERIAAALGLDRMRAVVKRRRMRPGSMPAFTQTMPACVVAMEASCGAPYLGRLLMAQGHIVRHQTWQHVFAKLLIHGAWSILPTLATSATRLGDWLGALMQRVHKNAAVVALANTLARIVWVVLRRGKAFDAKAVKAAA